MRRRDISYRNGLGMIVILLLGIGIAMSAGAETPTPGENPETVRFHSLLDALKQLPLQGPSRGGPYVGLQANEATKAVVAQGKAIVPLIVERLRQAGDVEAAWLVFCLRELKAVEAREAVETLQTAIASGKQYAGVNRTLTVDLQLQYYLRDAETWTNP